MKIARKISFSFALVAILLSVSAVAIVQVYLENVLQENAFDKLAAVLNSRIDHIECHLNTLEHSVEQLALSSVLRDFLGMSDKESAGWNEVFDAANERLRKAEELDPLVNEYFLMNTTGRVVASSDQNIIGEEKADDVVFIEGMKIPFIGDVPRCPVHQGICLIAAAPVFRSETKEFMGVVALRFQGDKLCAVASEGTGLGETGKVFVVDRYGNMLRPLAGREEKEEVSERKVRTQPVAESRRYSQGEKYVPTLFLTGKIYHDHRGVEVLGVYHVIPRLEWTVIAEVDTEEAFSDLFAVRWLHFFIVLGAVLLAWLMGTVLGGYIARPLQDLREGTEKIGSGDLNCRVGSDARDEIGYLSRAFDAMVVKLKHSMVSVSELNKEVEERGKIAEELKDTVDMLDQLAKQSRTFIWETDNTGRYTYLSPAVEDVTGYSPDELLGKSVVDMHPVAGREIFRKRVAGIFEKKDKVTGLENPILSKNGEIVWILSSGIPVLNERGDLARYRGSDTDITRLREMERKLEKSELLYSSVFKESMDAMIMVDIEGHILSGNPAAVNVFGFQDEAELAGRSILSLSPDQQPEGVSSHDEAGRFIEQAREEGSSFFEWTFKTAGAAEFPAEVLVSRIGEGDEMFLLFTVSDVTLRKEKEATLIRSLQREERNREVLNSMLEDNIQIRNVLEQNVKKLKEAQDMLVQAEKMASLGNFAAEVAHEVNNPLMIIFGNAQISLMDESLGGEVSESLRVILEESQKAKVIMQRLLKFARPGRGRVSKVNINESLERVVGPLVKHFESDGVSITREYDSELPDISIDEQMMNQVFTNIVVNAKEAMPEGGKISIKTRKEDGRLRIDIKDTGKGIPEEVKKNVFEPFFTTKQHGTGLGLGICYNVVKAHGGEIKVKSELNRGTVMTVILPFV